MIQDENTDRVIIASRGDTYVAPIVRCLDVGVEAMVEKLLTINAESAALIEDAVARTGPIVCVTFNYQYLPGTAPCARSSGPDASAPSPRSISAGGSIRNTG